jgi:DNA-binding protein HU-beta
MDDFKDTDLVCVTRYCPNCGTEIFCRSDFEKHRVFYLSEDMRDPTTSCPRCEFNLLKLPLEELIFDPDRLTGKGLPSRRLQAGQRLVEAVYTKGPEAFPSKAAAKRALNTVGAALFDLLSRGEKVRFPGIGSFAVKERRARTGRNPRTGEEIRIPAKKTVSFSPAKALKERLKG